MNLPYRIKAAVLASIAAVLSLALVLGAFFSPEESRSRANAASLVAPAFSRCDVIEISGPETYVLRRTREGWNVEFSGLSRPARPARVEDFIARLASVRSLVPTGSSDGDLSRFGLSRSALRVRAWTGDSAVADFAVGSWESTGNGIFVLPAGSGSVFLAESRFASYLSGGRTSWHDLSLSSASVPFEEVSSISVTVTSRIGELEPVSFALERTADGWKPSGGSLDQVDRVSAESLLRAALQSQAGDYADPAKAAEALASPVAEIAIETLSAGTIRIVFARTISPEALYVYRSDGQYPMIMSLRTALGMLVLPPPSR